VSVIVFSLLVAGWLYARGTATVWRLAGRGHGVRVWQAIAFGSGCCAVGAALVSPLDALADNMFSAHMAQHLILITVAAPLLAVSGAHGAFVWALPRRGRTAVGGVSTRLKWPRDTASLLLAFTVHSVAIWVWHLPALYEGALRNDAVHALEHVVLLGSGVLFWSAATRGLTRAGKTLGASVLFVFALGAQSTGLGALITTARSPWYGWYTTTAPAHGLAVMDDQVLAGALMWVPAGFVYLGLALLLLGAWLRPLPGSGKQNQTERSREQGSSEQRQYYAKPQQVG
jgi:cytochrome c oxidase assembly factor CtaG